MPTDKPTEKSFLSQNPDATPYDMLMAGAITQARFDELNTETKGSATMTAKEFAEAQQAKALKPVSATQAEPPVVKTITAKEFAASKKMTPSKVIKRAIQPELTTLEAPKGKQVWLNDKKLGKSTLMAAGAAERERRKYPNRYTIS